MKKRLGLLAVVAVCLAGFAGAPINLAKGLEAKFNKPSDYVGSVDDGDVRLLTDGVRCKPTENLRGQSPTLAAVCVAVACCMARAEKMTVYAPAKTVEEKTALAERTLEYVKNALG